MCRSINKFSDTIAGCPDTITVNAYFAPGTNYYWEIKTPTNNVYNIPFTTDENGFGEIPLSALPEGFCNPYLPGFTIRVKTSLDSCDYEKILMVQKFESIAVTITDSNTDKAWIGCAVDLPATSSFTSGRITPTVSGDSRTVASGELYNAKAVIVFQNGAVMSEGEEADQYTYNPDANEGEGDNVGTITFHQDMTGVNILIVYFK